MARPFFVANGRGAAFGDMPPAGGDYLFGQGDKSKSGRGWRHLAHAICLR